LTASSQEPRTKTPRHQDTTTPITTTLNNDEAIQEGCGAK